MQQQPEKKEVLTVIRYPLGGIRTYIKYVYGAMPKGKYHFTIVIVKEGEKDSSFMKSDLEKRGVSFTLHEVTGKNPNKALIQFVYKLLKEYRFNLIHSNGFTSGILSVIANTFTKTPHIITSHGLFTKRDKFEGFKGKIKKIIIGMLLGKATVLQSVGEDAQVNLLEYMEVFKKKSDKLTVIKNGIEIEGFSKKRDMPKGSIRKELNIINDEFLLGYLGRFMPEKGFEDLIDAVDILSRNPEWGSQFKILAVNDGDYIREYKKLINERKLNDFFIFYGFVPDVSVIINDLDAVLMPSLWEAYSLLPMEAFVMGCPVIATNCVGLREVVKDSPAIIASPRNGKSLAEKIIFLMENINKVTKETKQFIPFAEERYSIKHTANGLDLLFERVIDGKLPYV